MLAGLTKGYKTRADGSKTSYFDRSEDIAPEMKKFLDAQKAPKKLDVSDPSPSGGAAGASSTSSGAAHGSAWNTAGTYEEKDVSKWASKELTSRLGELVADVEGHGVLLVDRVKDLEGNASIISNRGKVKRPFEYKWELEWVATLSDKASTSVKGVLAYAEVTPAAPGAALAATYECSERSTSTPPEHARGAIKAALAALRGRVDAVLRGFVDDLDKR